MVAVAASIDPRFSAAAFSLTPDPGRLFLSHEHARALAQLRDGLERRRGLVVVVGEVGTGKTTLAYAWLSSLGADVRTAYIGNTRLPFEGLLRHALAEFGVVCEGRDRLELLGALGGFVDECARAGRWAVLVIDEAQSLGDDAFEQLGTLGGLQLVLLGQPELDVKLRNPRWRVLAERVAVHVELAPMDRDESRRYVQHRLEKSGGSLALFAGDALELILDHAAGIPRRMNVVCHNALLLAYAAGASQVTRRMVAEAIDELAGGSLRRIGSPALASPRDRHRRARLLRQWSRAMGLGLAVGAVMVGLWWRPGLRSAPSSGASSPATAPVSPSTAPIAAVVPTTVPVAALPSSTLPDAAVVVPPTTVAVAPTPTTLAVVEVPPPTVRIAAVVPTTVPVAALPSSTLPDASVVVPPTTVAVVAARPTTTLAAVTPPTTPPSDAKPPPSEPVVVGRAVAPPPAAATETPPAPAEVAPAPGVSDAEVRGLLERYERAWRSGDVAELQRIGQVNGKDQAKALERYFASIRGNGFRLHTTYLDVQVRILEMGEPGEQRTVRFLRQDRFRDPLGREITKETPPIEKTVERTPAGIRFVPRP